LTEGIDLPNLTGILPLRELNKVKFLQTCGRAARITESDRQLLLKGIKSSIGSDGTVQLNQAMEKPCYWVIDPQIDNSISEDFIKAMREEYELEPFVRDFKEPHPATNDVEEAETPYLSMKLNKIEDEAKTILEHDFELYRLTDLISLHLPKEEQLKNKELILLELDKELDKLEIQCQKN
jgi:hypothetical protein